jgi:DNA-binding MarR family transcriptional regulator
MNNVRWLPSIPVTRWLSDEEQRLWRLWITVTADLQHRIQQDLEASGLTEADYEILAHLSEAPGDSLRMTDLARQTLFQKSRLTYRVAHLETLGLVSRQPCEGDARGVLAVLTKAGRRTIEKAAPSHVETVRDALIDHLRPGTRRALIADFEAMLETRSQKVHGAHHH